MTRTFERSTRRRRRTLDGQWEFRTDPDDEGVEEGWADSFPAEEADTIAVPSSWNARSQYAEYVGPAWYRREFSLPTETSVVFRFEGIGHAGTVFLDGEEILSTEGGYTPSWTYRRDLEAGAHELVVRADNRATDPRTPEHWFPQGGLYREVVLEEVSGPWVSDLELDYDLDGDDATVEATATLHNVTPTPSDATVLVAVGDETAESSAEVGGLNVEVVDFELEIPDVDRWSPDDPTMYDVVVAVRSEEGADDLHDRIGFREVSVDGGDVFVNGEPVDLAGVNRHEDHPDWGHAEPLGIQGADLDAVADAGFDAVRCADYPVHPRFLDLCDERGILVVEGVTPMAVEDLSPGRYTDPAHVETSSFESSAPDDADVDLDDVMEQRRNRGSGASETDDDGGFDGHDSVDAARTVASEMVQRDAHHPSIVAWDVGSDYQSGSGLRETASQLRGAVRGLDDSRLVTATTHVDALEDDPTFADHLDLVSVTVGSRTPGDRLETVLSTVDDPVFVTGFGDVGIPGHRHLSDRSGTESRQAATLVEAIESLREHDDIAGFAIERFADRATDAGPGSSVGADYTGILSATREPKEAYRALARHLTE